MQESLIMLGFVLLVTGIILILVGNLFGSKDSRVGGGAVIGPFVIGFGNDPQLAKIAIIVSAILAILFIIMLLKGVL